MSSRASLRLRQQGTRRVLTRKWLITHLQKDMTDKRGLLKILLERELSYQLARILDEGRVSLGGEKKKKKSD